MSDFTQAGHLPNRRQRGDVADPRELPRQRAGTTPQMHGRFPEFDVLAQARHWDAPTREVVLERVLHPPPFRFFTPDEQATLREFADVFLAQDAEPRIPTLNYVDANLAAGRREGYVYAGMPDDDETWRLVARGLDEAARARGSRSYALAPHDERHEIVAAFAAGELRGGVWDDLPVSRAWSVVTRDLLSAFYAHPWAWNEIGFGGPAYPRGYARLGQDAREPWERDEAFSRDPVRDTRERGVEGA